MADHKQLSLLTAAIVVGAGLLLAQPARALTTAGQPVPSGIDQGRVDLLEPVTYRNWHSEGDRSRRCDGRRSRSRQACKPRQHKSGYYRYRQKSGYYKPWEGIQLCTNCPAFK
jgi:hypothetical protein